jgi:hypothetical protein
MKKICILLALVLALACVPAFAAEGDALLGISNENRLNFSYGFSQGDTLYMVSYGTLYTYKVGDSDLKEYSIELPEDMVNVGPSFEYATLPFAANGKLYSLNLITEYNENTEFKGATVTELTIQNGNSVKSTKVCDVDWDDLVEYYENSSYPIQPDSIVGLGGQAFARYYDSMGDYHTLSIDLASGETRDVDWLVGAYTITPYKDGTLLAEVYDAETDNSVTLVSYNPAEDSVEMLSEIPIENYTPLIGLAYDPATDNIYCIKGGEVCMVDLQNNTISEGLTEMPIEAYTSAPGCILDGGYYAFCSEGVGIRNLDPSQKAQSKLRISDSFWNESVNSAYYRYANAHGDVSVVLSREFSEVENLIENMMNRDDQVDVYVLSTSIPSMRRCTTAAT